MLNDIVQFHGNIDEFCRSEVYWFVFVDEVELHEYRVSHVLSLRKGYISAFPILEDGLYVNNTESNRRNIVLLFARQDLIACGFREVELVDLAHSLLEKDTDDYEEYRLFEPVKVEAKGYFVIPDKTEDILVSYREWSSQERTTNWVKDGENLVRNE